jgi:hypothetical protein
LIDLGHIRDHCDLTLRVYRGVIDIKNRFRESLPIATNHGRAIVNSSIREGDILDLASAIAYDDGVGYEIYTYDNDNRSSFSPEDLPSNYLGTELARRAIQRIALDKKGLADAVGDLIFNDAEWNAAVAFELDSLLSELGSKPEKQARDAIIALDGIWFKPNKSSPSNGPLLKRNFRCEPWSPYATEKLRSLSPNDSGGHPSRFSRVKEFYKFQFDYENLAFLMWHRRFNGADFPGLTEGVRRRFLKEDPTHSDRP